MSKWSNVLFNLVRPIVPVKQLKLLAAITTHLRRRFRSRLSVQLLSIALKDQPIIFGARTRFATRSGYVVSHVSYADARCFGPSHDGGHPPHRDTNFIHGKHGDPMHRDGRLSGIYHLVRVISSWNPESVYTLYGVPYYNRTKAG